MEVTTFEYKPTRGIVDEIQRARFNDIISGRNTSMKTLDAFIAEYIEIEKKAIAHDHLLDQLAKDCKCKEYLAEYGYKGPTSP